MEPETFNKINIETLEPGTRSIFNQELGTR